MSLCASGNKELGSRLKLHPYAGSCMVPVAAISCAGYHRWQNQRGPAGPQAGTPGAMLLQRCCSVSVVLAGGTSACPALLPTVADLPVLPRGCSSFPPPRWAVHTRSCSELGLRKGVFPPTILCVLPVPFFLRYGGLFVKRQGNSFACAAAFPAGALSAVTSSSPAAGTPCKAPSSSSGPTVALKQRFNFSTRDRANLQVVSDA